MTMAEYIEREAALNVLCQENCGHDYEADKCNNCYTSAFIEYIPASDVAPVRHGKWEPRNDVIGFDRCSVCHDCNIYDDWADGEKWSYCPNCGAKMDGEQAPGAD